MSSYQPTRIKQVKRKLIHVSQDNNNLSSNDDDHDLDPNKPISKKRSIIRKKKGPPKTRSKSGCFTCRKRKKKCDEGSPVCSGCARNFLQCVWPSYSSETMPKDFKIKSTSCSSTNSVIPTKSISCTSSNYSPLEPMTIDGDPPTVTFTIETKTDLIYPIEVNPNDLMNEEYDIPDKMCSVISIGSYKHHIPEKMLDVQQPTSDPLTNSISPSPTPFVNSIETQSVNQMFTSLYNTLKTEPFHLQLQWPAEAAAAAASAAAAAAATTTTTAPYSPLTAPPPSSIERISSNYISSPTLSSENSATSSPASSSNNVNLNDNTVNDATALREMLYSCGASYLGKRIGENSDVNSHYNRSINMFRKPNHSSNKGGELGWVGIALNTIKQVNSFLGITGNELDGINLSDSEPQRYIVIEFSMKLAIGLYFCQFDQMMQLPNPFQIFDQFRNQISNSLFNQSSASENHTSFDNKWLYNVVFGSALNCLENSSKLFWLLRMHDSLTKSKFDGYLSDVKADMTLTWTTLQTSEIHSENISISSSSDTDDDILCILSYAKTLHQALEILHLRLSDLRMSSSNPLIGFYIDQLIQSYELIPSCGDATTTNYFKSTVSKIIPLFISGCASKSLTHREFISKELYLSTTEDTSDKNVGKFVELLVGKLEDAWCAEENNLKNAANAVNVTASVSGEDSGKKNKSCFDWLISRIGWFDGLSV